MSGSAAVGDTNKRSRTVLVGSVAIGLLVTVGLLAGLYLALGDDGSSLGDVPKIAAALSEADFRAKPDPETRLRPLISVLAEPVEYDAVAYGRDGTFALAIRQLGVVRVVRFAGGELSSHELTNMRAVTALAIDPEGTIYVGLRQGGYAHIDASGAVHQEAILAEGYSVVGFAFDPASRRSAVMLSGGEVRTGLRPLRRDGLNVVTMPARARVRSMTYDGAGDLWVAGDAGAVFASTDDGWEERNVMTPGRVTAFGAGPDGDVLVGQAGGQIYRESGSSWSLLGQIGATPVAVGADAEGSVVVAGANGSLFRAADDTTDFVELPGYQAPSGELAVHSAVVLGPVAAFATPGRAWVYDDVLWDSSTPEVQRPDGAEARVVPIGPWSDRSAGAGPLLFTMDGDDTTLSAYEGGGLVAVDEVPYRDGVVRPSAFRLAVRAATHDRRLFIDGAHYALDDYGISRWDGAEGFTELHRFPEDAGRLLSASATTGADGIEVVAITDSGAIYAAQLSGDEPVFVERVRHTRFQQHYGDDFYPNSASVVAIAPGRLLVVHDQERLTRVDLETDEVEPIDLGVTGRVDGAQQLPAGALVLQGGQLIELDADLATHPWTLPEGVIPRTRSRRGHAMFAMRGDDVLLGGENGARTLALRCRARTCGLLPLPVSAVPSGLYFGGDDEALIWTEEGVLSVLPLGTSS